MALVGGLGCFFAWTEGGIVHAVNVGVFVVGAAFGSFWVLVPAIEREWYGKRDFGRIHGVMMVAAYVFSNFYSNSCSSSCI